MVPEVPEVPVVREVLVVLGVLAVLASGARAQTTANARAVAEASMMKADRDFDQAAADRNIERFLSFVAENAAFDSAEGRGRDAVRKAWAPFLEANGPTLRWKPT